MKTIFKKNGFAFTYALIFLFLVISFVTVFMLSVASGYINANRTANAIKAYYAAEAGLVDAYERIIQSPQNTPPPSTTVSYIPSGATDDGTYSVAGTNGNYSVNIMVAYVPRITYTVTSTGTFNKVSKTLQLKMIGKVISTYAYWSQTEINPLLGPLWWVGVPGGLQYYTYGPVQTNGQLNIWGNPFFFGPVAEAASSPNYMPGTGSNPSKIWLGGLTNNAPPINLPPQGILRAINTVASSGGLVLTGPSTVIFNPTGTITVTGVVKNNGVVTTTYNNTTISPPGNGTIYVQSNTKNGVSQQDGNATVQGTVNGQLTVAADQNIYISNNVALNSDPRQNPASTDLVGLVANQNITVIAASAPQKLELATVMVALQGSFQVDQWWLYKGDGQTAVMDQYGSLTNYVSGVTGVIDMGGHLISGWNQLQSYDNRLLTIAPPGFPPYVNNQGLAQYIKLGIQEP